MKLNFKIWHLIISILLLILILQFGRVVDIAYLFVSYLSLLFGDFSGAVGEFDFRLADSFFALIVFILVPLLLFVYKQKIKIIYNRINFSAGIVVILILTFFLAPLITADNPEFQKNLSVTKHLPPFSKVKVLHLKVEQITENTALSSFRSLRKSILRNSFDESIILIDNAEKLSSEIFIYYQRNIPREINIENLILKNGEPLITSKSYLLGTDEFGRNTFTRLIYGLRISLLVGIGAVIISFVIGVFLGFVSGYKGGWIDTILNRFAELFLAFPVVYLVVLVLALFSNSLIAVIIVLGISGWMSLFKIVRGEVASLKQKDYMITSKLIGLKTNQLLFKDILPVIIAPVIVNLVFQFSNVILAESALSYLGLSAGAAYPSWGSMIQSGQEYITSAWWMILFPGACLVVTLFSANDFGRKLNKFFNPRLEV